ncbi:MAG: efflux RND transporter periplasmic adaptor subunit [Spirochaetales bacterium]|nr:efflux RND transporter periplasmic adaptor subunit [Spirochaetales bacterium]
MTKKKKSKAWIPFAIIILVISGFIGFRILGIVNPEAISGMKQDSGNESENEVEESVFAINTAISKIMEVNEYLDLNGDVVAATTVEVYPETTGKLIRIPVKVGSYVRKDDVVAWIDPSRPGMNYAESPVKSPITGTVTGVYGSVGGMAAPQGPLLSVGDLSSLQVNVYVPEIFTSRIYKGMNGTLSFETFPGETFPARVQEISPVVDPISRTMEVTLSITGGRNKLKAGMFAEVSLVIEKKSTAITVPSDCIVRRFDNTYIFTIQGDFVKMVPVVPGISENGFTEILEGIEAEQEIVYQGMNLLEDGAKVRIVNRVDAYESL